MSLFTLLGGALPGPGIEQRTSRLLDAVLWRLLLGLAVLFLILAAWRVLEGLIGPILAPLTMAAALAITAGVLAFLESRRKQRLKAATPPIAPLVATVLEIAFAPKLVRWFAIGSLIYDVATGSSPLGVQGRRRVNPAPRAR